MTDHEIIKMATQIATAQTVGTSEELAALQVLATMRLVSEAEELAFQVRLIQTGGAG